VIVWLLLALGLLSQAGFGQSTAGAGHLVIIVPFENFSKAPGIDWIGEAFPEVLGQRFSAAQYYVVARPDRVYAFDRLGIPVNTRPSRATLLRIAEEIDVDYLVTGNYTFDGKNFTAHAQVMDVKHYHLSPEVVEAGALTQLVEVQNALAWDLLRTASPGFAIPKEAFVASLQDVRLDALENYIRGLLASTRPEKIKYLKEAVRLSPEYAQPLLQLGKTYYENREYESAMASLSRIPKNQPSSAEANYYMGLSAFYTGRYERAAEAFKATAATVPLIEVYNNLGVVTARLGKKSAADYFQRAVEADARDPDYRFNLGVTLYRAGDLIGAARQLRECLAVRPQDAEAKALLETITARTPEGEAHPSASAARLPMERIKRNYDETSYRQLALEIQNANEIRYASMPGPEHAAHHVAHGADLFDRGLPDQAENDFREAILLDPTNAGAHLGLARVQESRDEFQQARMETSSAIRLKPSVEAYLLLAAIDMKQSKPEAAQENIDRALKLDPTNSAAAAMRQDVIAQTAAKSNPAASNGKKVK
jgi:tetratricopeptide (TPR) repeat protein